MRGDVALLMSGVKGQKGTVTEITSGFGTSNNSNFIAGCELMKTFSLLCFLSNKVVIQTIFKLHSSLSFSDKQIVSHKLKFHCKQNMFSSPNIKPRVVFSCSLCAACQGHIHLRVLCHCRRKVGLSIFHCLQLRQMAELLVSSLVDYSFAKKKKT